MGLVFFDGAPPGWAIAAPAIKQVNAIEVKYLNIN
jgi:hypothetical protein